MGNNLTIKKGLKELTIYSWDKGTLMVEIFQGRGMDVDKDNQCLQIQLTADEVGKLINYLEGGR